MFGVISLLDVALHGVCHSRWPTLVQRAFCWVWTHSLKVSFLCYLVVYLEGNEDRIFRGVSYSITELIASITLRITK